MLTQRCILKTMSVDTSTAPDREVTLCGEFLEIERTCNKDLAALNINPKCEITRLNTTTMIHRPY